MDGSGCFHKCCLVFLVLLGLGLGGAGISFLARSGTSDRVLIPEYNAAVEQWNHTYFAQFDDLKISTVIQPGRQSDEICPDTLCPRSTVEMKKIEGNSDLIDPLKKSEMGHTDRERYTTSYFTTKGLMPSVPMDEDSTISFNISVVDNEVTSIIQLGPFPAISERLSLMNTKTCHAQGGMMKHVQIPGLSRSTYACVIGESLVKVCVRIERHPSVGWTLDNDHPGYIGVGCDPLRDEPTTYRRYGFRGMGTGGPDTIMQQLELVVRDAHDPWIFAENATHDTGYFGESKADKRVIGTALLITGLLLLVPPACRSVCLWQLSKEERLSTRYEPSYTDSPEATPRSAAAALSTRDRMRARSELGGFHGV
jgi:hypothetical protein